MASYVAERAALVDTKVGGVVASTVRINVGVTGTVEVAPSACVRVVVNSGTVVAAFVFTNSTVVAGIGVADSVVKGVAVSSSAGKSVNSIDKTDAVADGDGVYVSVSRRADVVADAVSANSIVANRTRSVAAGIAVADPAVEVVTVPSSTGIAVESTGITEVVAVSDGVCVSVSLRKDVVVAAVAANSIVANRTRSVAAGIAVAVALKAVVAVRLSAGKAVESTASAEAIADGVFVSIPRSADVVAATFVVSFAVANWLPSAASGTGVADSVVEGVVVASTAITEAIAVGEGVSVSLPRRTAVVAAAVAANSIVANRTRSVAAGVAVAVALKAVVAATSSAGKAVESTAITEDIAVGEGVNVSVLRRTAVVAAAVAPCSGVANRTRSVAAGIAVADPAVKGVAVPSSTDKAVESTATTEAIAVGEGANVSVPRRTGVVAAAVSANSIVANRTRSVAAGIAIAVALKAVVAVSSSAGKSVNSIDNTDRVADGDGVYVSVSRREDVVAAAVAANSFVANRTRSVAAGIAVAVALKGESWQSVHQPARQFRRCHPLRQQMLSPSATA